MNLKKLTHTILVEYLNENLENNITSEKRFVINNNKFQLFLDDILVCESYFIIEQPDELFDQKYVGLFKLETKIEFRGKGFMKHLLGCIFDYVKNDLNINNILLNVYKNNDNALKLYLGAGFEIYKNYDNEEDEDPYFTLIKKLTSIK
jgi:ribosomal protein S18 acetylase RimI-like enzyme